ncbi:MAG: arylsulfotransferase family protein [Candidatus Omnitrophota bacterium]
MSKKNNIVVFISASIFISAAAFTIIHTNIKDNTAKDEEMALEQFRALPYLSYAEEKADKTKKGVVFYDKEKAFEGYNLCSGILMDMEGNTVHDSELLREVILDNGYIIKGDYRGMGKYRWDLTPIWERKDLKIHHDITLTPDDTILTIAKEVYEYNGRKVEFDIIVELDQNGDELARWSAWENLEYIKQFHNPILLDKTGGKIERIFLEKHSEFGGDYDYHHLNSIQALPENPLAEDKRFQKGNWLISLRNLSLVLILDKDTKKVAWSLGPEEVEWQHMPRMLSSGNILIFDNGKSKRRYSRVIELNPATKEIVWEYRADPPESFLCISKGSAQRLPNGNTLIADSQNGRAFEVTKEKEIVWEWYNPRFDKEGKRETIGRIIRYPRDMIDKILKENKN